MRVALVTWGDPSGWRRAKYSCSCEGYSTLSCMDACGSRTDLVLLLVQDSMVIPTFPVKKYDSAGGSGHGCDGKEEGRNEFYERCQVHTPCGGARDELTSYAGWLRKVRDYASCMAREMAGLGEDRLRVLVVPSKGRLIDGKCRVTGEFDGIPDLMYSTALLQAYRELAGAADEEIEIVFDLTHGINYFTHIAAQVARDLAGVLSIGRAEKGTRLVYYGAIPVAPGEFELKELLPRMVKPRITPTAYVEGVDWARLTLLQEANTAIPLEGGLGDWARLTSFALRSNAPLLLLRSLEGTDEADGIIEKLPELLQGLAEVRWDDANHVSVSYNLRGLKNALKKPGAAYMSILRDAIRRSTASAYGPEYSLKLLNGVKNEVFSNISELAYMIVEAELENLNRAAESLGDGDCRRYQDLIKYECSAHPEARGPEGQGGQEPRTEGRGGLPRDLRNFVAHAGLLKELTYVCMHGQEIYLRYKEDDLCEFLKSQRVKCPWASSIESAQGSP
ncbi:MAG: TM1812 family CRISPR-associated protein [Conexivisphaera sp.]